MLLKSCCHYRLFSKKQTYYQHQSVAQTLRMTLRFYILADNQPLVAGQYGSKVCHVLLLLSIKKYLHEKCRVDRRQIDSLSKDGGQKQDT